jgi:translocation and assembly module TamB
MKPVLSKRILLAILAGLLLLIAALFAVLVATETGTQFAWRLAHPFLPDTIKVDAAKGRLIGPLVCEGITVETGTSLLQIERIELEWSPTALLGRRLEVQRLAVEGVRFTQLTGGVSRPEEKSEPVTLPAEITLPIDVNIDALQVRRIEFRSDPTAEPVGIETLSLKLSLDEEKVDLLELYAEAPRFTVKGSVGLSVKKDLPIHGELRWRFNASEYPELKGRTHLDGSLSELKIRQTIDKPYGIDAEFTVKDPIEQPRFQAKLDARPDRLNILKGDLPPVAVHLTAAGQGDLDEMGLQLSATVQDADLGSADIRLNAKLRSGTLSLDGLSVTSPDHPVQLKATGQISFAQEHHFQFKTHWKQLQWPLQRPRVRSPKGQLLIEGRIDDYAVDIAADVKGPEKTDAAVRVSGRGTKKELNLTKVAVDVTPAEGGLSGTATIGWDPEPMGKVNLSGEGLNPGVVFESWPGDLQVELIAQGRFSGGSPEVKLEVFKADGRLRGLPFSLDAQGAYGKEAAAINRFILVSGAARLQAHGTIGKSADISWKINSEDLASLHPDAKGRVNGKGRLTGPARRPRCQVDLHAKGVAFVDYQAASLDLAADVDLSGEDNSSISLDLQGGMAPGVEIRKLDLEGHGGPDEHAFMLVADTRQGMAGLEIRGKLQRPWQSNMAWHFQTVAATLAYPELDAWSIQKPFSGEISAARLQISQSCWQSGQAKLCLSGQRTAEKAQAEFEISDLPFSYFQAYLPEGLDLRGGFGGKGAYGRTGSSAPTASVLFNTSETGLWSFDDIKERPREARQVIEFLPGRIRIDLHRNELKADMVLPVSETDGIDLKAAISAGTQPMLDRPLTARMRTGFQNLDFIEAWLPEVEDLTGRLTGDLALSGSLRRPRLKGRLELTDGSAKLERPGLELKEIGIFLTGEENGAIRLAGRSVSGRGDINFDGTADFRGNTPRVDMRVKGRDFTVLNTSEAQVDTSPDLKIGLHDDRIDVKGEVKIPKAKIELKKLPTSAVRVSDDQTIAEPEGEAAEVSRHRNMDARVRITLGEEVTFDGFGLSAGIQGSLLAIEKPGEPTTGSGELRIVDGTYEAFGQKLDVEKGRVLFAGGPINRPGIDARAVRRPAEGILVGVNVRGDLRQPDVTLFSDPVMTQGNQLSYLVLGRPLSGTSGGEGSALSRAVLALGLKSGNVVAEKIGGELGLDQFTVESGGNGSSTAAEQASLVIGKYLTPKLYINYGLGLFDPVSTLRVQYAISSNWKLVTESSGTASGGDFIYTIETGR